MSLYHFISFFPLVAIGYVFLCSRPKIQIYAQLYIQHCRKRPYYLISVVKPTRCTNVSNIFYFGMTLYMFRTVFPSIIRGSRLYVQQQAFVKHVVSAVVVVGMLFPTHTIRTCKHHFPACTLCIAGRLLAVLTARHTHTAWKFPLATSLANMSQCL